MIVRSIAVLLAAGLLAASFAARAQDTAAQDTAEELQPVVITGSRIPVPANVGSTSPITTVTAQDLQLQGQTDTSEVLNALPQNFINADVDLGNHSNPLGFAGGVATADLRGLGPQRTLVLVDGKRLGTGDPTTLNPNPAPDLDQIPAALIERIDVVTGGASAVYGSDAIAGVINFIMKKDFQGIQVSGQYGVFQHNNGQSGIQALDAGVAADTGSSDFLAPSGGFTGGDRRDLSIVMGTNTAGGNGNITGYLTYHKQLPVAARQLDYANCELFTNASNDGYRCAGSLNSNVFETNPGTAAAADYSVVGNQFLPWPQVGSSPPAQYNTNPYEYVQRQDVRYNAGLMAHIDLNEHARPYLDFSFMNDRTTAENAPASLFYDGNPFTSDNFYRVNCSNPYLSAQEQSLLCTPTQVSLDAANPGSQLADIDIGLRNIDGGARVSYFEHTNYRLVLGVRGAVASGWSYDAYGQYYYTSLFNTNSNYLNYANVDQALLATSNSAGQAVCTNTAGGCVPYDIFTQGAVTAAQLAYLQTPGTAYGTDSEGIAHVDFTGDLSAYGIRSPLAHGGVGVNLGAEHRYDTLTFAPDAVEAAGELTGYAGAVTAINATDAVDEGFIEARAPLLQDRPWASDLDVDAGYRYSSYSIAGGTSTYKLELQYSPTPDLRLRYSYDRAVRAPNLMELFHPSAYALQSFVGFDPCAGATPSAPLAQCEHTGVTPSQYGAIPQCVSGQCGQVIRGNSALRPEQADTYSVGITLTPRALPNLIASVDYYHIAIFDEIGVYPGAYLFDQCLASGNPLYCGQIVRNQVTGALTGASVEGGGYITQQSFNLGTSLVSGIDVQAAYRQPLGTFGTLTANLNGSYLQHTTQTPFPGGPTWDCAGLFGVNCNNTVNPRWRHTLRLNWQTPWSKLLLSLNWRFIGASGFDNNSSNPALQHAEEGGYDSVNARIANYSYFDLAAVWPAWRSVQLRAGMNNMFDKDPPIIPGEVAGTGAANTYPTYDLLGREVFVAFTAQF
jgi:outer membrane receptor protein involved in Fe transport